MLVSKRKYDELQDRYDELKSKYDIIADDSPEMYARRMKQVLTEFGISQNSDRYQEIAERAALELLGRQSEMLKRYSQTAFVKDTDEDTMERVLELIQNSSAITRKGAPKRLNKK